MKHALKFVVCSMILTAFGCASQPEIGNQPSAPQADSDWSKGKEQVSRGQEMVNKGEELIKNGRDNIRKGEKARTEGQQLIESGMQLMGKSLRRTAE
ncbi:MAG: hypothetical protein ACXWF8_01335 [Methylobacter sp.]